MAKRLPLNIAPHSNALADPNVHDGGLLGILITDRKIELTVVDTKAQRYCIILDEVVEFLAMDFKQGNIILDITIVRGKDTQPADLEFLNASEYSGNDQYRQKLHQRIVDESLYVLQLNPSYGCPAIAGQIWIE